MTAMDIWQMLEADAPQGCEGVQDLYSWSLNYPAGTGPIVLLLDLIGYSEAEYGEPMYDLNASSLGYVEIGKLAKALTEYAEHPQTVYGYVEDLMRAESETN